MCGDDTNSGHPLHKKVGAALIEAFGDMVRLDQECVSDNQKQRLPLFMTNRKASETRICCVDALIIHDERVRVIVEVDETNIKPTHVCGKFMTSALAKYFIHEKNYNINEETGTGCKEVPIEDALFIQILSGKGLSKESLKPQQGKLIQDAIRRCGVLGGSLGITSYRLLWQSELAGSREVEADAIDVAQAASVLKVAIDVF